MDRKYISPAFLLDAPLFWRPVDKFHFIINLDHMMKRGEIMQGFIDRCLFLLRKKYSYKWMSVVKCDPVLKSVLEHSESHYPTNSLSSVIQYCSNVYLHYNDNITAEISIINIKSEFSTLLPELYLHLFEGLINYAIGNKSRYRMGALVNTWSSIHFLQLNSKVILLLFCMLSLKKERFTRYKWGYLGTIVAPSGSYRSK
ncbi:hypothetical protein PVK06_018963 [Gossypium arboreum]|uniref:Uncharacterized protein n=1 Tax=Gossypium arboreum TaxID=29729 RepID=A0ABR0PIF2_GOSAR|nr:hypothetical protein PVK06_018963 [Gossypium arboreum]